MSPAPRVTSVANELFARCAMPSDESASTEKPISTSPTPKRPTSSPTTDRMKSLCASGRKKSFCCPAPKPTPNSVPARVGPGIEKREQPLHPVVAHQQRRARERQRDPYGEREVIEPRARREDQHARERRDQHRPAEVGLAEQKQDRNAGEQRGHRDAHAIVTHAVLVRGEPARQPEQHAQLRGLERLEGERAER